MENEFVNCNEKKCASHYFFSSKDFYCLFVLFFVSLTGVFHSATKKSCNTHI